MSWSVWYPGIETTQASAGATVTPGVASLTLTLFAPTVSVSNHITVTPGTASLSTTRFAPTVTIGINVTPTNAALTLTRFAPTVTATNHQVVTPGTRSLTLTLFAPTVSVSGPQSVTPGTASLVLTLFAPTVDVTEDTPSVIVYGGDDAPRKRKKRTTYHDLFHEIEQTIHQLMAPESAPAEIEAAKPAELETAIDELVELAQGQHALLQQAASLRADLNALAEARRRFIDEDEAEWEWFL